MNKISFGAYSRPFPGEHFNGDVYFVHRDESYALFSVIDGLGHGPSAYKISKRVLKELKHYNFNDPKEVLNQINKAVLGSEGSVIGIGTIKDDIFEYVSLGNIGCRIFGEKNITMIMRDGILGSRIRSFHSTKVKLHPGDMIIMHSDGVHGLEKFRFLKSNHLFSCEKLARMIVEDLGSDFDDSTALVVKFNDEI